MASRNFKTPYNLVSDDNFKFVTCPGSLTVNLDEMKKTGEKKLESGYEYTYKEVNDSKGRRQLVIAGRNNTYAKIQSYKDDVDIYKIVERCTNGEIQLLDSNMGFYADVANMPKSYNEYHNKFMEGQRIFAGLPVELKDKFGHNVNEFMNSIYDKSFESKYNEYVKQKQDEAMAYRQSQVVNNGSDVGGDKNE